MVMSDWLQAPATLLQGAKGSNKNYTEKWMVPRKGLDVVKRKNIPVHRGYFSTIFQPENSHLSL
jgi:hypothetical protein